MPLAMAGEESTSLSVAKVHTLVPVAASRAWTSPVKASPTYTTPFATVGGVSTLPVSCATQRGLSADGALVSVLNRVCAASKPNDCQSQALSASADSAATSTRLLRLRVHRWM